MKHSEPRQESTDTGTEPAHIAEARDLLREVSLLVSTAMRVSRVRTALDEETDDDRDDRIQLLRHTLDRIGWVADVVQRKLGGTGTFERAEDWMLPGA